MTRSRSTAGRGLAAAAMIATVALTAGCGTDDESTQAGGRSSPAAESSPSTQAGAAAPFGPACGEIPASGPGSVSDLASQPVATAAAQSPVLSTLATAVTKAGLADTLNSAEAVTVFAPSNDAFAKIPQATLGKVLADKAALTKILTYHVVPGRQSSDALDGGSFTSLEGSTVTTAKNGESYRINDASVICGNVQTRNATVHIIDTVLMPMS